MMRVSQYGRVEVKCESEGESSGGGSNPQPHRLSSISAEREETHHKSIFI